MNLVLTGIYHQAQILHELGPKVHTSPAQILQKLSLIDKYHQLKYYMNWVLTGIYHQLKYYMNWVLKGIYQQLKYYMN